MRWTVPVPMPSDLATFKIPTPFASCFRTLRSIVLSIFGPAELHALGNGSLANHAPLILDDLQEPKTVGLQAAVEATRNLLPKLEVDLKALTKAYNTKRKIGAR